MKYLAKRNVSGWGPGVDTATLAKTQAAQTSGQSMAEAIAAAFRNAQATASANAATSVNTGYNPPVSAAAAPVATWFATKACYGSGTVWDVNAQQCVVQPAPVNPVACPPDQVWSAPAQMCLSRCQQSGTTWDESAGSCVFAAPEATAKDVLKDTPKTCPPDQVWSAPAQICLSRCQQSGTTWDESAGSCVFAASDSTSSNVATEQDPASTTQNVATSKDPAATEKGTKNYEVSVPPGMETTKAPNQTTVVKPVTTGAPPATSSNMWLYGLIGLAVVGGGVYYFSTRKAAK